MRTTSSEAESETNPGRIFWGCFKETAKQFFYELLFIFLMTCWALAAAIIVWGSFFSVMWGSFFVTEVFVVFMGLVVFAVFGDGVNSFFSDDRLEDRKRRTEEFRRTALALTLIPLARKLPGLIRRWLKPKA